MVPSPKGWLDKPRYPVWLSKICKIPFLIISIIFLYMFHELIVSFLFYPLCIILSYRSFLRKKKESCYTEFFYENKKVMVPYTMTSSNMKKSPCIPTNEGSATPCGDLTVNPFTNKICGKHKISYSNRTNFWYSPRYSRFYYLAPYFLTTKNRS